MGKGIGDIHPPVEGTDSGQGAGADTELEQNLLEMRVQHTCADIESHRDPFVRPTFYKQTENVQFERIEAAQIPWRGHGYHRDDVGGGLGEASQHAEPDMAMRALSGGIWAQERGVVRSIS
jgi:hypothetical protein